jgi:hypothetical protein
MIFLKRCAIVPLSSISHLILCGLILCCFISDAQSDIDNSTYNYKSPKNLKDGIRVGQIANTQMDSNLVIELTRLILKDSFPNTSIEIKENEYIPASCFDQTTRSYPVNTCVKRKPRSSTF